MGACDTRILLVSVTLGGSAYGTPTVFQFEEILDDIGIPAAGVPGNSCLGLVRADVLAMVEYLEKGHKSITAAAASLVGTYKDTEGDSITDTIATMKARGPSSEANRDAPTFKYRQRLRYVGDFSSDPVS